MSSQKPTLIRAAAALALACAAAISFAAAPGLAASSRNYLTVQGRVMDHVGRPVKDAWVFCLGSRRASARVDSAGWYRLEIPGATLEELQRTPLKIRVQARKTGWRFAMSSGAPELGLEMSIVSQQSKLARLRVRSNDSTAVAAVANSVVLDASPRALIPAVFVGSEGSHLETPAVALDVIEEITLAGGSESIPEVGGETLALPVRPGTSPPPAPSAVATNQLKPPSEPSAGTTPATPQDATSSSSGPVTNAPPPAREEKGGKPRVIRPAKASDRPRVFRPARDGAGQGARDAGVEASTSPSSTAVSPLPSAPPSSATNPPPSSAPNVPPSTSPPNAPSRSPSGSALGSPPSTTPATPTTAPRGSTSPPPKTGMVAGSRDTLRGVAGSRSPGPPGVTSTGPGSTGIKRPTDRDAGRADPTDARTPKGATAPSGRGESTPEVDRTLQRVYSRYDPMVSVGARPEAPSRRTPEAHTRDLYPDEAPNTGEQCDCVIRGTVEVQSDYPLRGRTEVVVAVEDAPQVTSNVELFMGSPRGFEIRRAPCGVHRLRLYTRSKQRFVLVSVEPRVVCRDGSKQQVRLVMEPVARWGITR